MALLSRFDTYVFDEITLKCGCVLHEVRLEVENHSIFGNQVHTTWSSLEPCDTHSGDPEILPDVLGDYLLTMLHEWALRELTSIKLPDCTLDDLS